MPNTTTYPLNDVVESGVALNGQASAEDIWRNGDGFMRGNKMDHRVFQY